MSVVLMFIYLTAILMFFMGQKQGANRAGFSKLAPPSQPAARSKPRISQPGDPLKKGIVSWLSGILGRFFWHARRLRA
ncbi:hypothetical protein P7F60_07085 [Rhizobium sp. YJ-22]|nr:hypothetical protein [Rhizobium sp. YJ-22]